MTVSMARRMFELVEPIGVIPYSADEPNEAMFALGFTNYWDTYFAGRVAPLGAPLRLAHGGGPCTHVQPISPPTPR